MAIQRVLIANRGEVVERIVRSCRRLGIETVAIYSDPDADARFVELADLAVPIGGSTPSESYLDQERVLRAARQANADAVHPGYGFLAENAAFAEACLVAGLTFIGPSPEAIATMGDKVAAKAAAQAAGVPLLHTIEVDGDVVDETRLETLAWPLIVKAAAGGGGKGMQIVQSADALADAVRRASREAKSAFGDGRVFIERYLRGARHVEVQVFGDRHGNVAILHERECSVQRRHQKVVEEAPSAAVDPALRSRLADASKRLAEAVRYEGAGTVEYLLDADGQFFFLEMNTRLQVEHAVTEEVTGLDLVALQIAVAQGEALPPEALHPRLEGAAIEVRLYAEDPTDGFAPAVGDLRRFAIDSEDLRVEAGVRGGDTVTPYYDPMLAKVIAHAPTRAEAAQRLAKRLADAAIDGVVTNRDLLVRILRDPAYLDNDVDTQFLERSADDPFWEPLADAQLESVHALAAGLAITVAAYQRSPLGLPLGWRNNRAAPQRVGLLGRRGTWSTTYEFAWDGSFVRAEVTGPQSTVTIAAPVMTPDRIELVIDGVRRSFSVLLEDDKAWVTGGGASSALTVAPRFPAPEADSSGSLTTSMPGMVIRVDVTVGDVVEAGDVIAVLEAMKMEIEVVAPAGGIVSKLAVAVGDQVEAGRTLAVINDVGAETTATSELAT